VLLPTVAGDDDGGLWTQRQVAVLSKIASFCRQGENSKKRFNDMIQYGKEQDANDLEALKQYTQLMISHNMATTPVKTPKHPDTPESMAGYEPSPAGKRTRGSIFGSIGSMLGFAMPSLEEGEEELSSSTPVHLQPKTKTKRTTEHVEITVDDDHHDADDDEEEEDNNDEEDVDEQKDKVYLVVGHGEFSKGGRICFTNTKIDVPHAVVMVKDCAVVLMGNILHKYVLRTTDNKEEKFGQLQFKNTMSIGNEKIINLSVSGTKLLVVGRDYLYLFEYMYNGYFSPPQKFMMDTGKCFLTSTEIVGFPVHLESSGYQATLQSLKLEDLPAAIRNNPNGIFGDKVRGCTLVKQRIAVEFANVGTTLLILGFKKNPGGEYSGKLYIKSRSSNQVEMVRSYFFLLAFFFCLLFVCRYHRCVCSL
jgi:hypothetical protein